MLLKNNSQNTASGNSNAALITSEKRDRKILFVSNRDGNDEIYSMNVDGSNIRLTNNIVPDGRATWSANDQHIALPMVVVMALIKCLNIDGSNQIFLLGIKQYLIVKAIALQIL